MQVKGVLSSGGGSAASDASNSSFAALDELYGQVAVVAASAAVNGERAWPHKSNARWTLPSISALRCESGSDPLSPSDLPPATSWHVLLLVFSYCLLLTCHPVAGTPSHAGTCRSAAPTPATDVAVDLATAMAHMCTSSFPYSSPPPPP